MNMPTSNEWEGLESFVDELRRLEAPDRGASWRHPVESRLDASPPPARSRSERGQWGWRTGLLAAGVAAMVTVRFVTPRVATPARALTPASAVPIERPPETTASSDPRAGVLAFLSPWPSVAMAQSAPGAPPLVPYAPLTALDPTRLKPGVRSYVRLSANDYHASLPHEIWTNELDSVRYEGQRTWRLVRRIERRNVAGEPSNLADTLWMRASDLRLIARRVSQGSAYRARSTFTDTSMREAYDMLLPPTLPAAMRRDMARRGMDHWARTLVYRPGSPYIVSSEYLRLLLRAAPLTATWRASVQVDPNPYERERNAGFANLRVAGVDTVQLFSGRYPAWRVVVEGGKRPETWYVSQQTGETLVTDGPLSVSYPESRSLLVYGLEETAKAPPVRRR